MVEDITETPKTPEEIAEADAENNNICIEVPLEGFTPETLDNLFKMVAAKAELIKRHQM